MVNYTPISILPYPAMSDPPNGPEQILALATALEHRITNRFANAAARNLSIPAPQLGMLTFRDDERIFEFWNGSAWETLTRTIAIAAQAGTSVSTDKPYTTDPSAELATVTMTITNPSAVSRMRWCIMPTFNLNYKWTVAGLYATVRHSLKIGDGGVSTRTWSQYTTAPGLSINFSGIFPTRSGFLAPSASVVLKSYLSIEKSNSVAGTITMTGCSVDMTVWGVTTI